VGRKIESLAQLRRIEIIEAIFNLLPVAVGLAWLISALYSILTDGLWGRAVAFITPSGWLIRPHSLTLLVVASFLLFAHWSLDYLLPHMRAPLAFTLTALGFLLYDFTWILGDFFTCGSGNPLIQASLVLAALLILLIYDRHFHLHFLTFEPLFLFLFVPHLLTVIHLSQSGFYALLHSGVDPHVGNWVWFIGKLTGVWCVSGLFQKRVSAKLRRKWRMRKDERKD